MISDSLRGELVATANAAADAARLAILPYFRNAGLSAENKLDAGFDPVTEADCAAERAMRDVLAKRRPDDGILGEEYGSQSGITGLTWILDPIDGTRAFLAGTPTWGVLIAVSTKDGPIYGIIDQPFIGERFCGGFGDALYQGPLGSYPLKTRPSRELSQSLLFTTFPEVGSATERAGFEAVAQGVRLVRYGMDCYAYGLVAAGQVDLVIEAGLAAHDISAPIAVIEAAGGVVTDWHGNPVHDGGRAVAAASREQHTRALTLLAPFADG